MIHHSYQCLLVCKLPETGYTRCLVAASGSILDTFRLADGRLLSTLSLADLENPSINLQSSKGSAAIEQAPNAEEEDSNEDGPPVKKRKTTSSTPISETSSAEIVVDKDSDGINPFSNAIIKIASTSDGRYVIVVTGEDKCLRVLKLSNDGHLQQVSKRAMPKRPCAIAITPDDTTILCGDKFGDVYSLPLLGQTYELNSSRASLSLISPSKSKGGLFKPFMPSATDLTVHTQKNRNALKQQQKQSHKRPEKPSIGFDSQLLLGHVSLLTDLALVSGTLMSTRSRSYIITSDRDEHIRVSRGIPQTHTIEGFCLGHTQFVSRIRVLGSKTHLLLSGGGDEFLLLWSWMRFSVLQKIDLRGPVNALRKDYFSQASSLHLDTGSGSVIGDNQNLNFAVSHIEIFDRGGDGIEVIIVLEATPALLFFHVNEQEHMEYRGFSNVEGNVIDVAIMNMNDHGAVLYSMDTIHRPFSTSMMEDSDAGSRPSVGALSFVRSSGSWQQASDLADTLLPNMDDCARNRPFFGQTNAAKGKSLRELLYGLENLRKRGGGAEDPEVEEAA